MKYLFLLFCAAKVRRKSKSEKTKAKNNSKMPVLLIYVNNTILFGRILTSNLPVRLFSVSIFYIVANQFLSVGTAFVLVNNTLAGVEVAGNIKVFRLAIAKVRICIDFLQEIGSNGKC